MPKFFADKSAFDSENAVITGENVSHISRVLRMREGDALTLCDGCGTDFECEIESISKNEIICKILSFEKNTSESEIPVTLFQSMPKGAKMDFIIQKCVELGIYSVVPFISARTVAKGEKSARFRKIAEEAAKQSGRGIVPYVSDTADFDEAVKKLCECDLAIICYEEEKEKTLKSVLKSVKPRSIGIMIGPEGGFEADEVLKAVNSGAVSVTLGRRILRTETAGMAVLADIVYEYDL